MCFFNKQIMVKWLRDNNLLWLAEKLRFYLDILKNWGTNRTFKNQMKNFVFPPWEIAYDAYSSINHPYYYTSGFQAAKVIYNMLCPYLLQDTSRICEWGCGPARIIRHMPQIASAQKFVFMGTDYNKTTISWCQENIKNVEFFVNGLTPPLSFPNNYLDCVYCISVFTHLSKEMHFAWLKEIMRVLKPGGVFMMSMNGDNIKKTQLKEERELYESGQLVVRGNAKEGSRTFLAFHSPIFMRETFLNGYDILKHDTNPDRYISSGQDIWIVRKPSV